MFLQLKRKEITYNYFKAYSTTLSYVVNVKKRNYYNKKFSRNEGDCAKLWSTINSVFGRKNKTKIHEIKMSNGDLISDKKNIADQFNKFFIEKPKMINNNIQHSLHDYGDLVPENNKSFRMLPTTAEEIVWVAGKLKNGGGGTCATCPFSQNDNKNVLLITWLLCST